MSWTSRARRRVALVALAASIGSACALGPARAGGGGGPGAARGPRQAVYPGAEWEHVDPAAAGLDPATLEDIAAEAGANRSNCLVVVRHGRIAGEWYWNGTGPDTAQEIFSTTKSFAGTLVGLAQGDGALDVHDRASRYIPEWVGTPSEDVTIANILRNDSGRHWDYVSNNETVVLAPDRTAYGIGLGQDAPPGTTWYYNNPAIQTLDAVLEAATGQNPADYAQARLLDPLGMRHSRLTRDGADNANMFFGLQSTCRDMARFGYLFLRHGRWQVSRILPRGWVEAATRPSQRLNAAYGYLWWLNRRGRIVDNPWGSATAEAPTATPMGQVAPGAPEDLYWAWGLGGQVVQVHPGSDTVVVRLGAADTDRSYGRPDTARVVTEALRRPGPRPGT